jgi:D-alanine-D-alanine ligase
MRIVVLMGGTSPERKVSLESGRAVAAALTARGHVVETVDVRDFAALATLPALRDCEVVFPALHGGAGEDGRLQALLELIEVPYALSGPMASAMAMNKAVTKRLMRGAGIPTPDWLQVAWDPAGGRPSGLTGGGPASSVAAKGRARAKASVPPDAFTLDHVLERAAEELGFPLVIKPNREGSSVGVEIVKTSRGFKAAFGRVAEQGRDLLLERFVPGRELTAAIVLGRRLPLLEIRPRAGDFYDFDNKYTRGACEYLVPAPVHSPVYEQISADALRLYDLLECRGMARVDVRLDGDAWSVLEINTIPGMTETSLVPKAAAAVGIGFADLVDDLCRDALAERGAGARRAAPAKGNA